MEKIKIPLRTPFMANSSFKRVHNLPVDYNSVSDTGQSALTLIRVMIFTENIVRDYPYTQEKKGTG
jgi:hypothetical protein